MQKFSALIRAAVRLPVAARSFSSSSKFTYAPKRSAKENEDTKTLRARLLYQSKKRGILENDILIGDFADEYLGTMSHDELLDYDKLINGEHMEWDLYYYMSGKKRPPVDVANSRAFHKLREYVAQKAKQEEK